VETQGAFQRARRPEQVQERRAAILAAARGLLARHRLADVSLRELAEAGMAPATESISATLRDMLARQLAGTLALADRGLAPGNSQPRTGQSR
jgi:hypothetical protein